MPPVRRSIYSCSYFLPEKTPPSAYVIIISSGVAVKQSYQLVVPPSPRL